MAAADPVGVIAVRLARGAIDAAVQRRRFSPPSQSIPPQLRAEGGVFVTLTTHPQAQLRGCIGYPEPVMPRIEALLDAAVSAALHDPRFPPVRPEELAALRVEVTLLSVPELLIGTSADRAPSDLGVVPLLAETQRPTLPSLIRVGTDGLIVEHSARRGLLLPQVAPEQGWDVLELLGGTCRKAGLPPDAWQRAGCVLWRFQGTIFEEVTPGGDVHARPAGS